MFSYQRVTLGWVIWQTHLYKSTKVENILSSVWLQIIQTGMGMLSGIQTWLTGKALHQWSVGGITCQLGFSIAELN